MFTTRYPKEDWMWAEKQQKKWQTHFFNIPPKTIITVIGTVESTSRAKGKFSLTFPFPHKHYLALLELSLLRGRHIVSRCEWADEEENRHRHFAVIIVIHSVSVLSVLLLYIQLKLNQLVGFDQIPSTERRASKWNFVLV